MDISRLKEKPLNFLKKYRFAVLILILGIVLMQLPSGTSKVAKTEDDENSTVQNEPVASQLESILSMVKGAGKVRVFLSEESGAKTVYQTDTHISSSDSSVNETAETVIITDSDRNERGLVLYEDPPVYRGAVVVCEGADDYGVQLAIINAVASVTGLRSDRITVLKMK